MYCSETTILPRLYQALCCRFCGRNSLTPSKFIPRKPSLHQDNLHFMTSLLVAFHLTLKNWPSCIAYYFEKPLLVLLLQCCEWPLHRSFHQRCSENFRISYTACCIWFQRFIGISLTGIWDLPATWNFVELDALFGLLENICLIGDDDSKSRIEYYHLLNNFCCWVTNSHIIRSRPHSLKSYTT